MAIEKFSGKMNKEDSGCTIMVNETIQSIRDISLAGLYCYLLSKPSGWVVNPKEIMSHFSITNNKAYKHIKGLIALGLLTRHVHRQKGRFVDFEYTLHLKPLANTDAAPFLQKPEMDKSDLENHDTYKTKNIKNKEYINKNTISESNDSPTTAKEKVSQEFKQELIETYHEVFPDNPKHMTEYIAKDLDRALTVFIQNYPKINKNKEKLTVKLFEAYLQKLKSAYPQWTMSAYKTDSGRMKKNNLVTFVRMENVGKILEGRML